jgi:hypothetical protein
VEAAAPLVITLFLSVSSCRRRRYLSILCILHNRCGLILIKCGPRHSASRRFSQSLTQTREASCKLTKAANFRSLQYFCLYYIPFYLASQFNLPHYFQYVNLLFCVSCFTEIFWGKYVFFSIRMQSIVLLFHACKKNLFLQYRRGQTYGKTYQYIIIKTHFNT